MKKDRINLAIISVIFIILSIFLFGKSGNVLIDFSRESYIPYQMLNGLKLNRDIFLIYGSFGYFLNMLLYKIFLNINLLFMEAVLIAYSIAVLFYFIIKKYTKKLIALIFTLFLIIVSVFSNSDFSFVLPYSFSTLWAIFGIYLFLFCELYKKEKIKYFILGFIAINKVELFVLVLIYSLICDFYYKKFNIKNYLLSLICPLISLIGFNLADFSNNLGYISKMTGTKAINSLYKGMGSFFEFNYFKFNLFYLAIYLIFSSVSCFLFKKHKIISILILLILFIKIYPNIFFHLGFFVAVVLTIINRKKIGQRDILLLFFTFVLCSKSIFSIDSLLYSNFGYCLMIFYITRQAYKMLNKKWVLAQFITLFLVLSYGQFYIYFVTPKKPFKTDIGTIWLAKTQLEYFNQIDNYFKNNLKENETFIVVPEGQIFNLIYKKPWNFYNSTFTPLDFETFGQNNLIGKLKENKTDYVVFYPRTTREYGAKTICFDYAVDFCKFIDDNYKQEAVFGDDVKVFIYKINGKNEK